MDLFLGWVTPVTWKMAIQWLSCQAAGIVGSVPELAKVYRYLVRWTVWSATSISVWQQPATTAPYIFVRNGCDHPLSKSHLTPTRACHEPGLLSFYWSRLFHSSCTDSDKVRQVVLKLDVCLSSLSLSPTHTHTHACMQHTHTISTVNFKPGLLWFLDRVWHT